MIKIVTHNGSFHTDDVFAVATVMLSLPEDEEVMIIRTRDNEVIAQADYVVDVGLEYNPKKRRFDHHQPGGAGGRDNGIPYASFGLVWKEYGEKIAGSADIAREVESKLVLFVDALDNGVDICEPLYEDFREYTISDYLYSFWIDEHGDNPRVTDTTFRRVVSLAKSLLSREIEKAKNIREQSKIVEEIYNNSRDKRLIIMDKHLAWGKVLTEKPEPLIAIYPSSGTWRAKVVRVNLDKFDYRILFPESWAGKTDGELARISGVEDALFCHRARFTASAKTKEGIVALARKVLENYNNVR